MKCDASRCVLTTAVQPPRCCHAPHLWTTRSDRLARGDGSQQRHRGRFKPGTSRPAVIQRETAMACPSSLHHLQAGRHAWSLMVTALRKTHSGRSRPDMRAGSKRAASPHSSTLSAELSLQQSCACATMGSHHGSTKADEDIGRQLRPTKMGYYADAHVRHASTCSRVMALESAVQTASCVVRISSFSTGQRAYSFK